MHLTPHLSFAGQCEAAFKFYERCFGGTIVTMLAYGDSPAAAEVLPDWRTKIVHATLTVGTSTLTGADVAPAQYEQPKGFAVLLGVDDPESADRIFHALAEEGTVRVPIQTTFWSARYGMVTDRFGIPWEINCEQART